MVESGPKTVNRIDRISRRDKAATAVMGRTPRARKPSEVSQRKSGKLAAARAHFMETGAYLM